MAVAGRTALLSLAYALPYARMLTCRGSADMCNKALAIAAVAACATLSVGCGGTARDPVGVWEMEYQDAVGQPYLDVLVLRPDGSYDVYMRGSTRSDAGRYSYIGEEIRFESDVDAQLSSVLAIDFDDADTMNLSAIAPTAATFPFVTWKRSSLTPVFETVDVAGLAIPQDLTALVATALQSRVLPLRADALPTALEVEMRRAGHAEVTVDFYSADSGEGLRMTIDAFHVRSTAIDGLRMNQRPLPAQFVELPEILITAAREGPAATLRRASLRTYAGGPAWMIVPASGRGSSYSAVTGERIEGDVTGYIASYEADWKRAGEIWSEVIRQQRPRSTELSAWEKQLRTDRRQEVCEQAINARWQFGRCDTH